MFLFRPTILWLAVAALAGWRGSDQSPDASQAPQLEGTWVITSVQQDGKADKAQIGAKMVFTGDEVKFQPKPTLETAVNNFLGSQGKSQPKVASFAMKG